MKQQLVTRTHGGIVATAVAYDLPARYRGAGRSGAKERIAAAACDLLDEGTVVAFNGGTTTSAVARRLAARPDLAATSTRPAITVVTNALNIATEMVLRPHVRTVTLGGIHHKEGRQARLRYVFLTPAEEAELQALAARGVTVVAQDVPSAPAIPLAEVLAGDGTG